MFCCNTDDWIRENQKFFLPPVCNKMLHNDGQMSSFFVGGPNQRKDYHIEEGEELFYQLKGDMLLKVILNGVPKDIPIREGEMFLLPANICHSPQRFDNTIGFVFERQRSSDELDGITYFIEENELPTQTVLFSRWMRVTDLGSQVKMVIEEYFASEEHKTGRVMGEEKTFDQVAKCKANNQLTLTEPFSLNDLIAKNMGDIEKFGEKIIFDEGFQFYVSIIGGENKMVEGATDDFEAFLWVLSGSFEVVVATKDERHSLKKRFDSVLIRANQKYSIKSELKEGRALFCYQNAKKKKTFYYKLDNNN